MKTYEQGWNDGIDAAKEALGCRGGGYFDFVLDRRKKPEAERCPYGDPDCPCHVSEPVITKTCGCRGAHGNDCPWCHGRIHKGEHVHKWTLWQYGSPTHACHCGATKIEPPEPSKPKMAFFVRKNGTMFEARPFSFTTPGQASCLGMGAEIRFQLIAPNVYLEL